MSTSSPRRRRASPVACMSIPLSSASLKGSTFRLSSPPSTPAEDIGLGGKPNTAVNDDFTFELKIPPGHVFIRSNTRRLVSAKRAHRTASRFMDTRRRDPAEHIDHRRRDRTHAQAAGADRRRENRSRRTNADGVRDSVSAGSAALGLPVALRQAGPAEP